MQIYNSKYQNFIFIESEKLFIQLFSDDTRNLTQRAYKEDNLKLLDAVSQVEFFADKVLVDMRRFHFIINEELGAWHLQVVLNRAIEWGLQKMAIISSADKYVEISALYTLEKHHNTQFEFECFKNKEEACQWLGTCGIPEIDQYIT